MKKEESEEKMPNSLKCKIKHLCHNGTITESERNRILKALEQEAKTGHCKDCKWWKDSDGTYRRGIGAESQCPINRIEVYEGNGYCFMFEPQESEEKENG